jgi:hypothetical protein
MFRFGHGRFPFPSRRLESENKSPSGGSGGSDVEQVLNSTYSLSEALGLENVIPNSIDDSNATESRKHAATKNFVLAGADAFRVDQKIKNERSSIGRWQHCSEAKMCSTNCARFYAKNRLDFSQNDFLAVTTVGTTNT